MRTRVRAVLAALLAALALLTFSEPAQADPPDVAARTGVDVSWPQCDTALPVATAFAIVGVNGGTASSTNRCLVEQLAWASAAATGSAPGQPRIQLYVNTANPGAVLEEFAVQTWPLDNVDPRGEDSAATAVVAHLNPYGRCLSSPGTYRGYTDDLACSWQYGWNRAVEAVDERFAPAALAAGLSAVAADYVWWLDVETMNSWQRGTAAGQARNTATLEGMTQFYRAEGVETVGLYSTGYQWGRIVGSTLSGSVGARPAVGANLVGLPSWLAGSSDAADAELRCTTAVGLTGGPVVLNQYILDELDHNDSCS